MNILDIIDRILRAVGLMRTARARHIAIELHALDQRQIVKWIQEDFNAPPKPGFEEEARVWAGTAFDRANATFTTEKCILLSDDEIEELVNNIQKLDAFLIRHQT